MPTAPAIKCLIVDDLEENLLALSALLRREGVEVLCARSGREALEMLLANEVALAILDVNMPEMSGFELAELMRGSDRTREVPIIFVTAAPSDVYRMFRGYETGAVDFLHKPVESHILRSKAEIFFDLYRQRQQIAQQLSETAETLHLNELFIAALGHDLRNPLNAILNSAVLIERTGDADTVRRSAQLIQRSGQRMSRMISQLLDLARVRVGNGLPIERKPIHLGELTRRVLTECEASFPQREVQLQSHGDASGRGDADRLVQAISNLVSNALQHGQDGDPVRVEIDGSDPQSLRLRVINTGEITADNLGQLFEPFQRARSSESRDGLGLGLFIVRQIAEAHGGAVSVRSDSGRTAFELALPRLARTAD